MRTRFYSVIAAIILFSMYPLRSWGQDDSAKQPDTKQQDTKQQDAQPDEARQDNTNQQQQEPTQPPQLLGGFQSEGSITSGYRFAHVKGDMAQYNDLFNLHDGFRVMNFNLMGRAPEGSTPFADSYGFTASGMGGDPYQSGQFTLHKDKLYDLRVNYRQSRYFWSQNNIDSQVMAGLNTPVALGGTPTGYTNGLTANHGWDTTRRIGSIDFGIRATNHLKFVFEYDRNSRNGMTETTRSLYYPAAYNGANPNAGWGSFATANPYLMAAPLDELQNRITTGFDYSLRSWTFHYRVGYQSFSQNMSWNNLMSPEQSINTSTNITYTTPSNINAITAQELLSNASWSEYRYLKTPISEFSYTGKANSWLELRGSYNFYDYSGPDTTDASFIGIARTISNGSKVAPYTVGFNARAQLSEPSHEISQGLTATIKPWWKFNADYRYSRSKTDGFNDYGSFYTGVAALPGADNSLWRIGMHLADVNFEFTPASSLVIRTGMRYIKRDVEQFTNGKIDTTISGVALNDSTLRTKIVSPTLSVFYRPVKTFSIRGDFQTNTTTDPYTRISAHTDKGTRLVIRYQPSAKISFEDNVIVRNSDFPDSSYQNRYRSNAANIAYNFSTRFSVNFGYSYDNIFASDAFNKANATSPFYGYQQDAFINRGLRAGIMIKPTSRFGLNLNGNFLRTTGASRFFSTTPAPILSGLPIVWPTDVGPLTYPIMTGTLFYDFPKFGRLSLDLQRAYYIEQIVSGNNFSANFLTISWTKNIRTARPEE